MCIIIINRVFEELIACPQWFIPIGFPFHESGVRPKHLLFYKILQVRFRLLFLLLLASFSSYTLRKDCIGYLFSIRLIVHV